MHLEIDKSYASEKVIAKTFNSFMTEAVII